MPIRAVCPHRRGELRAPDSVAGKTRGFLSCNGKMTVPALPPPVPQRSVRPDRPDVPAVPPPRWAEGDEDDRRERDRDRDEYRDSPGGGGAAIHSLGIGAVVL